MINGIVSKIEIDGFFWARPGPPAVMIAALCAILLITAFLYRRRGAPGKIRIALAVSRLLLLAVVVAALFEPTAVVTETHTTKPRLPILIDVSQSMTVKDQRKRPEDIVEAAAALGMLPATAEGDANSTAMALDGNQRQAITTASRLDLAKSLISNPAREMLDSLSKDLDISYHAFGKEVRMIHDGQAGAAKSISALNASDPGTSIGEALEDVANSDRGAPLAGIVLLSDGLDTSLRQAGSGGTGAGNVPVFAVPLGITAPDDVSIRNVVMQEVAFTGDKVPIRVQIRSNGYEKRTAELAVLLNGRSVATRSISLAGGLQSEDVFFNVDVQEKGVAQVEVVIEPFADEATAENNRIERSVRVVNEKINVLCMEGSARWEFRYLRAMLKRDPRINATFIATRSGPEMARSSSEYIARFPELREEAFQYDLVILGDVDAAFFTPGEFARLEELVKERGGSLLVLCGSHYAPTSYAGTPVERMLPVEFDPSGTWQDVDDNVYPVLTPQGRSSLVMTLETDPEQNDRIWSRVAPLNRIPPLLAAKPGATVLMELSDSRSRTEAYPLVSWQRYGAGKCMAIATDRLWLLRFKTGDKYHWRVWSQCIQFMTLSRLMGEHKRIRLETDRTTYQGGEQVQLYANVLDDVFDPVSQPGFDVTVSALGESTGEPQRVTLRPDAQQPGLYEGYFSPRLPGHYRLEANAEDMELSNATEFQVADINPEMANTDMQLESLKRIAEISEGKILRIQDFNELASLLKKEPHTTTVQIDRPLWDNGWVLLLIVALAGFEWIVRRRYDLT